MPDTIGSTVKKIVQSNVRKNAAIDTSGEIKHNIMYGTDNDISMNDVLHANNIYNRSEIEWYTKFNRFGVLDPYNSPTGTKEYLFFTKPDLHLVSANSDKLNSQLANVEYFQELYERYPGVISQLQLSHGLTHEDDSPFMVILSNAVKNTLEVPAISATTIENPANIYGTTYDYRGWGFLSDEKIEFSLEFEDTKYLEIYNLLKAYEEYERLKHIGAVSPPNIDIKGDSSGPVYNYYIKNKVLHDQFSIYKFIVEDDKETIIYYAKFWGVFFKNVPRDAFSDMKDGALTYAVDFQAAFMDDLNPYILSDFNSVVNSRYINFFDNKSDYKEMPIYDVNKRMIDGRWARFPYVVKVSNTTSRGAKMWNGPKNMKHHYKLKWRV